ncbi:unnamed protein product [Brassica napus]|nr:unnamed protein product [Brassica napus]
MSFLRRIVQNPTLSKAVPVGKAMIPFPLGRDPSSLPKINPNCDDIDMDRRPISLRYRVTAMLGLSNLDKAVEYSHHAVSEKYRFKRDTVFICNSVIGAMCDAKRYEEAISLFNYFFNESQTLPNMLSCNLIIKAHCDQGCLDDALDLFSHIVIDGRLSPGVDTYVILTKALVDAKRLDEACVLVASMGRCYFMVYDVLIRGLLDAGRYVKASQIIEELKSKLPWRVYHMAMALYKVSLMEYWFKQGKDEEAMEIYKVLDMSEQMNDIVGNRVLRVLVEHGKKTEAWELFDEIIGFCYPDTIGIVMKSFSDEKTIPLSWASETCYRTIIACLCEQGKMSEAEEFFAKMFSNCEEEELMVGPDVSTFRAMVNGEILIRLPDKSIVGLIKELKESAATKFKTFQIPVDWMLETITVVDSQVPVGDEVNLHCTSWRFAVETNNLAPWSTIPAECTDYVKGYVTDLERVSEEASVFASTVISPPATTRMRGFSTSMSNLPYYIDHGFGVEVFDHSEFDKWVERGVAPAIAPSLKLYQRVIDLGYRVFLLTGRKESHRVVTVENLINAGRFQNWDKLILRYT